MSENPFEDSARTLRIAPVWIGVGANGLMLLAAVVVRRGDFAAGDADAVMTALMASGTLELVVIAFGGMWLATTSGPLLRGRPFERRRGMAFMVCSLVAAVCGGLSLTLTALEPGANWFVRHPFVAMAALVYGVGFVVLRLSSFMRAGLIGAAIEHERARSEIKQSRAAMRQRLGNE